MTKSDQAMDPTPEEPSSASTAPKTSATTKDVHASGWSAYAERMNGRFAMIGFLAVVLTEAYGAGYSRWIDRQSLQSAGSASIEH